MQKKLNTKLNYPQVIALGFFGIIALGALLLMLPISSRDGQSAGLINSFFTATSATCVTGLVVVDTYTHWTVFGQIVILGLIQIGGLGFMTVLTMFSFMLKRRIGLTERNLLRESINTNYLGGIVRLTRRILFGTFIIEGIGALLLSFRFVPMFGFLNGIYKSIFTSISAFCNAGIDLMGSFGEYSSLVPFQTDFIINFTIMGLIVIGGIGFFVWDDLAKNKLHVKRYKLHTKIVLTTTSILIFIGAVGFFIFEYNNSTMSEMNVFQKMMASTFASITPRTAGFNSVDVMKMMPASKLLSIILMFIGGSPGSTAGGIKTTSLAIIFISLWANIRNKSGANVYNRRLHSQAISQATSVIAINATLVFTATILISFGNSGINLTDVMLETFSAMGTVGLSAGITRDLTSFAKIILMLLMYLGRVGSFSFALIFTGNKSKPAIQMPEEKISIG